MKALPSHSPRKRCIRVLRLAPVLAGLLAGNFPGQAQEIGRLYAAKPPPGYAFIRVVAATDWRVGPRIQVDSTDLRMGDNGAASPYRAVPGNQAVRLVVDGTELSGNIIPRAQTYLTFAIAKTGSTWAVHAIEEGENSGDGLKAKLRFFNLVPNCTAALQITDGPTIFANAAFGSVQSRTINPVAAKLEGRCGESSTSFALPQLRSGDYYSIFLRKDADRLNLTGQLDETEPYRER